MNTRRITIITTSLFLIFVLSQCSSRLYVPTEANVSEKATLAELNQGRAYMLTVCMQCHKRTPSPNKHTAEEWLLTLNKMQEIAGHKKKTFTNEQKDLIYKYIISAKK